MRRKARAAPNKSDISQILKECVVQDFVVRPFAFALAFAATDISFTDHLLPCLREATQMQLAAMLLI